MKYPHQPVLGILLGFIFLAPLHVTADNKIKNTSLLALGVQQAIIPQDKLRNKLIQDLNIRINDYPEDFEAGLLKVLFNIEAGDFETALRNIDKLIKLSPNFHLAHLIRGDILLARTQFIDGIGTNSYLKTFSQSQQHKIKQFQNEAQFRLRSYVEKIAGYRFPKQLLQLSRSIKTAIVIDKSNHRLYVYKRQYNNLPPKLVDDFYISTGKKQGNKFRKGDLKTPEGVYFITSWIPDSKLPEKYGAGAFPVNYPNELDIKQGKTGYGIWLHGMQRSFFSRPPLDSEGCVVLSNNDLKKIQHQLVPGRTPVIITENIDWVSKKSWFKLQQDIMASINEWRKDWQSMNVDKYLSHYSKDFFTNSHNVTSWKNRKRYLAKSKTYQKVNLSDVSLFVYPSSKFKKSEIVVVRLKQDYKSNNFSSEMEKRLYLRKEADKWQILYEGK
ncbi:MAG: L,D-transpeptidase family protein [Gammaproteobacteria bacterium]